jgi:hypothetical protein
LEKKKEKLYPGVLGISTVLIVVAASASSNVTSVISVLLEAVATVS